MTRLVHQEITCPSCQTSFTIVYNASINTWMDPKLAKEFLEGKGFVYKCPSCNQKVRLLTTILINTRKGMFNISTDAPRKERTTLYKKYGLIKEDGNFRNPQEEWIMHQYAQMNAPEDTKLQIRRQKKILKDIHSKTLQYKEFLKSKTPLDENQEIEFHNLQNQWEEESNREGAYLHHPKYENQLKRNSLLFHRLWEDLLKLKTKLDMLK